MTTYVSRQLSSFLAQGDLTELSEAIVFPWRCLDVRPSTKLVIEDGKYDSGSLQIAINSSYVLPLPNRYDSDNRLFLYVKSDAPVKIVVVSPEASTGTFILKGESTLDAGFLCLQERVTSITFSLPSGAAVASNIEYVMYEIPEDLLSPATYRDGFRTIGYVANV